MWVHGALGVASGAHAKQCRLMCLKRWRRDSCFNLSVAEMFALSVLLDQAQNCSFENSSMLLRSGSKTYVMYYQP